MRLLGQDPPRDLNIPRCQSDLAQKRRQRFQPRWCSQEYRSYGILAATERDRVSCRGEIDLGTGSAVDVKRGRRSRGGASCDGLIPAEDCTLTGASIRNFAHATT